jgi:hypothetical protein
MACQGTLQTLARGDCIVIAQSDHGPVKVHLMDCLHAPNAQLDLISIGKFLRKGFQCIFSPGEFVILGPRGSSPHLMLHGPIHRDLGFLPLTFTTPDHSSLPCKLNPIITTSSRELAAFVKPAITRDLWHTRMGHASPKVITDLSTNSKGMILTGPPFFTCESCIKGKHTRAPHPVSSSRTTQPLDLVHTDICGPMPVRTPHGKLYFVAFLDDHTHGHSSSGHPGSGARCLPDHSLQMGEDVRPQVSKTSHGQRRRIQLDRVHVIPGGTRNSEGIECALHPPTEWQSGASNENHARMDEIHDGGCQCTQEPLG